MIPQKRPLNFEDYRSWPDESRWELIDGHPYAMWSPSSLHQELSTSLVLELTPFFRDRGCRLFHAPMDVKLSDHDVVQPDLLVVCDPKQIRSTHIEGAPALVVEILSPSTLRHDRVLKLNLYARAGVAEYWLLTPILSSSRSCVWTPACFRPPAPIPRPASSAVRDFPTWSLT